MYGIPRSDETKEKLRLATIKQFEGGMNNEQRNIQRELKKYKMLSITRIDKITNEIKYYECLMDAVRDGFHRYHITECCRGIKKSHKGYYWLYTTNGSQNNDKV